MVKDNYITIFEKFLDIINWQKLKESTFLLDTDYFIAQNHLKTLIYFHIAGLDSLRDIHDFMESDSVLKEFIHKVSLGSLSNYNNNINFEVYVSIMNQIIANAMNQLSVNERIKEFKSVKLIDSSTICMALSYFNGLSFEALKQALNSILILIYKRAFLNWWLFQMLKYMTKLKWKN